MKETIKIEKDKYTFFVLGRIMGGECELLLTDHERLIIYLTCNPYPVWIWTPDDVAKEEKEKVYYAASNACYEKIGYVLKGKL